MFFSFLNKSLKNNICGIGCAAHVLHNAIQSSADILPIDLESIVIKIFSIFIYYILFILKIWKNFVILQKIALKSYFVTQDKCPTIIKLFFNDLFS